MSFSRTKTSNGIDIVSYKMAHVNSIAVNIIFKVGSRFESESEAGISHFLEHMAFKGTRIRDAKKIAQEFDSIGGNFNAYTSRENTVFHIKILHQHLHQAIEIMADILQNSLFAEEEIRKEHDVILQEMAESHDSPDDFVYDKLFELAYGNSPLGKSILGYSETLANINQKALQDYVKKHYHAGNMVISFAGKLEHEEIFAIAEQFFSNIPQGAPVIAAPAIYHGGNVHVHRELEQTSLAIGYPAMSYMDLDKFYPMQLLSVVLGGGLSCRLFQKIREDLGLAYSVGSWINSYRDAGLFTIVAGTDHNKLQQLLEAVWQECDDVKQNISTQELSRAKAQLEANIYMSDERPEYKAEEIGKNFAIFGRFFSTEEVIERILKINEAEIMQIANNIFSGEPSISILGVKK